MRKEAVVGGLTEAKVDTFHYFVREEILLFVGVGRSHEHVEREGLAGERTVDFRLGVGVRRAIEMDGCTGSDTGLVGHATELEVIILIEVVAGYRFAEAELEVVAYAEDSVRRFGVAEEDRRTGILDTADDGRSLADEARTIAAETYGTEVVLLLHRVTLAVEAERSDTAVLNHRLIARSLVVKAVVGIERAGVHPHLVALLRQFVLELDMVEVLVVDIKSADVYRQVIAYRVVQREGVHHPVLSWRSYLHRPGFGDEMHGEIEEGVGLGAVAYVEVEFQIFVVVHFSALYLHHLTDYLTRCEEETHALYERCTVHIHFRTMRVAGRGERESEGGTGGRETE